MAKMKNVRFLSPNPGKAAAERFYLLYTLLWGSITAGVMLSGAAESWGDAPLLVYGVGLWLPVPAGPLLWRAAGDRQKPFWKLYAFKMHACLFILAMAGSYVTFYFYEVFHMHYGFQTSWNVNRVPLFLYFLTVVYFSTYFVLLFVGTRALRSILPAGAPAWVRGLMVVPVALAVTYLEFATHATPFLRSLFCYDDPGFMLWFGNPAYSAWFVIAGSLWFRIDEEPGEDTAWSYVLLSALASVALILAANELIKWVIAPHFTTVVHGAPGLRDYAGSCLVPPGR
jgi:cycloeucalenol cycloisomerase